MILPPRTLSIVALFIATLLLSSYSSAAMSVRGQSSGMMHSNMEMPSNLMNVNCHFSELSQDKTNGTHHGNKVMCCDESCVAGYAFVPMSPSTYRLDAQRSNFEIYTVQYTSLSSKSLYRPPIA